MPQGLVARSCVAAGLGSQAYELFEEKNLQQDVVVINRVCISVEPDRQQRVPPAVGVGCSPLIDLYVHVLADFMICHIPACPCDANVYSIAVAAVKITPAA